MWMIQGRSCLECTLISCISPCNDMPVTKEEQEMYRAGTKKSSAKAATSAKEVSKIYKVIIPQERWRLPC